MLPPPHSVIPASLALPRERLRPSRDPQAALHHIQELLEKHHLEVGMMERQPTMPRQKVVQSLMERQQASRLSRHLGHLHPADLAFVLESLPLEQRQMVWAVVPGTLRGAVLLEVSEAVRPGLIERLPSQDLMDGLAFLESDDLVDLVPQLPSQLLPELLAGREREDQEQLRALLSFPEGTVGRLMDLDFVAVREDVTLDVVLRYLRRRGTLPQDTGLIMVAERGGRLCGTLAFQALLVKDGETLVRDAMSPDPVRFHTDDEVAEAAAAFERYDLISAPVVNNHHQLVGALNVEAVLEYVKDDSQRTLLAQAGVREEDLYAPFWRSGRNRWPWLALNLFIAFIASRVISQFEHTIAQVVALAALMPITANVGGNAGNQAMALVIRSLALKQLGPETYGRLVGKELLIGLMNGAFWGAIMGFVTWLLYGEMWLAAVMLIAMLLTFLMAGLTGVFVPLGLEWAGLDPVLGSTILITGITDTSGFLIFLGLAALAHP